MSRISRAVMASLVLVGATLAFASDPAGAIGSGDWEISPTTPGHAFLVYSLRAGESVQDSVTVHNLGDTTRTFTLFAADALNASGLGAFALRNASSPGTDVASWIHLGVRSIVVAPGKKVDVPFTLDVPARATPGDHVGGVVASEVATGSVTGLRVVDNLGVRLYARVGGATHPALSVSGLHARVAESFGGTSSVTFSYRVTNEGDLRETAKTRVVIGGPFGHSYRLPDRVLPELLPHGQLTVTQRWGSAAIAGRFTARVEVSSADARAIRPMRFWIAPWTALLGATVLMAAAIFLWRAGFLTAVVSRRPLRPGVHARPWWKRTRARHRRSPRLLPRVVLAASIVLAGVMVPVVRATASVSVAAANGASPLLVSAASAGGSFSPLPPMAAVEAAAGDLPAGPVQLDAPPGFEFDPAAVVSVADLNAAVTVADSPNDCPGATSATLTPTPTGLSFTICTSSVGTATANLQVIGLTARPSVGTPLAAGSITLDPSTPLTGVTPGPGGTAWATLEEVPGPTTRFSLVGPAEAAVAGAASTVTITPTDAFGNPTSDYSGTARVSSSDPLATLPADLAFTGGPQTAAVTLRTAGATSVSAQDTTDTTLTGSATVPVVAAPAARLSVSGVPSPVVAGAASTLTVRAVDAFNNPAAYLGTVHLTSSDPRAVLPTDYAFSPNDAGQHAFNAVVLSTAGSQSVEATDTNDPSIAGTQSGLLVEPAAAAALRVQLSPPTQVAVTTATATVSFTDAFGNVASDYGGAVHFSASDTGAFLPTDYTFALSDRGSHAFTLAFTTAGPQSLSVTARDGLSMTVGTTVTSGPVHHFLVTGLGRQLTAGMAETLSVTAVDAANNPIFNFGGTVHFTSTTTSIALPSDYTFVPGDGGTHAFPVTAYAAGVGGVQVTDLTDPSVSGSSNSFTVVPAAPAMVSVTATASPVVAGSPLSVSVSARDQFGNVVTNYAGTVRLTSTDAGAILPAPHTFVAGDAGAFAFEGVVLRHAGVHGISASDGALTGQASGISVLPGVAKLLTVTLSPEHLTAGQSLTITVSARDEFGNPATGYRGAVHLGSTDPSAELPGDHTFTSGDAGTWAARGTLRTAGEQAVTATEMAFVPLAASSRTVRVSAGPLAGLELSGISSPVAAHHGSSITVTAVDAYANVVTGYAGTVHFSSTDRAAALPRDYAFRSSDAGIHTFIDAVVLRTAGRQSVRASDRANPRMSGGEDAIDVTVTGSFSVVDSEAAIALPAITLNGVSQVVAGELGRIDIQDGRRDSPGWSVTATISDLSNTSVPRQHGNALITASNISLDPAAHGGCTPADPDADGIPDGLPAGVTPGPGGLYSQGHRPVTFEAGMPSALCSASPGSGQGTYIAQPSIEIRIPASLAAGTYIGTLTISAA